jgi:excisionase family DNA binding protein
LVDVEAFATEIDVSSMTVRRMIRAGVLPAYRVAGRGLLRVDMRDIDLVLTRVRPEEVSA